MMYVCSATITARVMENSDCADAKSSAITCCCTPVAETSSSHLGTLSLCHVGRNLRMTTGLTVTSTNAVETRPSSDMFVSVPGDVTRNLADVPATLRSKASATSREAPTELRGAVSLMRHPSLFATYGRSHVFTVSSSSELEKYSICMVSMRV